MHSAGALSPRTRPAHSARALGRRTQPAHSAGALGRRTQPVAGPSFFARLGWTRFGSPGIFGYSGG
ncbi:hypothetical protein TNCT6_06480 [Streptomyces sp. 6-11-2]|nr:hypothetical protein TNCT6_06480 [Streptomyces sp. 6-11-2]